MKLENHENNNYDKYHVFNP